MARKRRGGGQPSSETAAPAPSATEVPASQGASDLAAADPDPALATSPSNKSSKVPNEYVVVFEEDHELLPVALEEVSRLLSATGFDVYVKRRKPASPSSKKKKSSPEQPHVLKLRPVSRTMLDQEAEALQLWKQTVGGDCDTFLFEAGTQFVGFDQPDDPVDPNADGGFHAPRERAELLESLLEHVKVDEACAKRLNLTAQLQAAGKRGLFLLPELRRVGLLESCFPLHDKRRALAVFKSSMLSLVTMPVDEIREYYGEHVAFYYVFMNFFTKFLIAPAILGLILYFHRPGDITVDDSPYVPFFAIFVVIWAVVFIQYWRRECAATAYRWNTILHEGQAHVRPEFYGKERVSKITGRLELYYEPWRRQLKYCVSFAITFVMLGIAFAVMVCSLNLQGYIHSCDSYFHIDFLHQFAEPGAAFDPNGPFLMSLIPVMIHTTVIMTLNTIYRTIATKLTEWENHCTDEDHDNALILKRFFFEAFDCYIGPFYLAFWEQNVMLLRQELVSLYTTDAVRRVVTESVLPLLMQYFSGKMAGVDDDPSRNEFKLHASSSAKDNNAKTQGWKPKVKVPNFWSVSAQSNRDELELFDDYLEMVIEFGYVTLFAAAFPLAAAVSVICNIIEVHSDTFKLAFVTRRPPSFRTRSIGTWETVLSAQVWVSILTNTLIFSIGSDQMAIWFPQLFSHIDTIAGHEHSVLSGSGRYVMAIMWILEHSLILIAVAIVSFVPSQPEWVRTQLAHRAYLEHIAKWDRIRDQMHRSKEMGTRNSALPSSLADDTKPRLPPVEAIPEASSRKKPSRSTRQRRSS